MTVKQISVFLENRPGALAEFTKILESSDIDLRALSLAESEDFGIVRVIVDDPFATISPEDNWQLRGIYNALPEFWTEGEKGQFLYDAINNPE